MISSSRLASKMSMTSYGLMDRAPPCGPQVGLRAPRNRGGGSVDRGERQRPARAPLELRQVNSFDAAHRLEPYAEGETATASRPGTERTRLRRTGGDRPVGQLAPGHLQSGTERRLRTVGG